MPEIRVANVLRKDIDKEILSKREKKLSRMLSLEKNYKLEYVIINAALTDILIPSHINIYVNLHIL